MKRRRETREQRCSACGAAMARLQLRPPVYRCVTCEPLRPELHAAAWAQDFEQFFAMIAREMVEQARPYTTPRWNYINSQLIANGLRFRYACGPDDCAFYMVPATAMVAWRAGKAIYRFHRELHDEIVNAPLAGALPVEALMRLPVWCPYIECDLPVTWGCGAECGDRVCGVWVFLDFFPRRDETRPYTPVLRLVFDVDTAEAPSRGIIPGATAHAQLALEPGLTVGQALERCDELVSEMIADAHAHMQGVTNLSRELQNGRDLPVQFIDVMHRVISLVLYLCADNAETDQRAQPLPVHVLQSSRGPVLAEPPAATIVRCGMHVGERLRAARELHERARYENPRGTVAPHLRAAHWHHFWRGPREGPRELVLRWLAPILVGIDDQPDFSTVREIPR